MVEQSANTKEDLSVDLSLLLTRADEESIQNLLGRETVRLILSLNRQERVKDKFIDVLLGTVGEDALLQVPDKRKILLSLLRQNEAQALANLLGCKGGNAYTALQNMSISQGSQNEKKVYAFFGVNRPETTATENDYDTTEGVAASHGLFPHQRKALRDLETIFKGSEKRALLHMPTGSGKTRTAMRLAAKHLLMNEPTVVIWLAFSEELCEQATSEFKKTWHAIGDRELNVFRFWGKHDPQLDDIRDGILICGVGKAFNRIKKDIGYIRTLASRTTLIIMDEAHQAIAPTFKTILDGLFYSNQNTCLLGLSATPGRTYLDKTSDKTLADFFNQNKVILSVEGYSNPVEYLIEEGYLAKAKCRSLEIEGKKLSQDEMIKLQNSFEIPKSIIDKIVDDDLRNLKIINSIEELLENHRRIIVFAASVKHAELLSFILSYRGKKAYLITADTPAANRRNVIDEFKKDDSSKKVLCNYGVLTTGFDAPKTSAAVIARPTKSLVLYSQMVGRVTRGPRAGGQAEAEVVTAVDLQLPGFRNMVEAFINWEDVWK